MIELLASLVIGAMVSEWWQTYHGTPPPRPAASAPPAPAPVPPTVALAPDTASTSISPADTVATAPAAVVETTAGAPPPAKKKKVQTASRGQAAAEPVAVTTGAAAETGPAAEPVAAQEEVAAPSPLSDAELAQRALAAETSGDYVAAAADRAELLRRHPQDNDARRALVFALQKAGLPERALDVAGEAPGLLTPAGQASLYGDAADRAIALAIHGEPRPERNFVLRQRADAAIERACAWADSQKLDAERDRCASQRVVYLSGTWQHRAAADAYAATREHVNDNAHAAAARSLLQLGEIDAADAAWARRSPGAAPDADFNTDRLFAREKLRDASADIDQRIAKTPARQKSADGSVDDPNWERLTLESERLHALAWRGRLKEAIAGQEALVARAPADIDLRLQLADFYRQDGRRDRADAELRMAEALDPGNRALLDARIRYATEDGEFQDAHRDLGTVQATWPADQDAADLDRHYRIATAPWIEASVSSTRSNGLGTVSPSDELQQRVAYYGHAWESRGDTRLFVFEQGDVGEYATDTVSPFRAGIGTMTRHRDWDAQLSVHGRFNTTENATGASLGGHVRFSDHWEADALLQSDSTDTPLLALNNGISAWSADAGLQYNVRAGHYYRLAGQQLDLDDGNRAIGVDFTGRQPLHADAPHAWALIEHVDTVGHDLTAVPYFSPERMSSAELQLEYTGVLRAHGDYRWEHVITLGGGASRQSDFGSAGIYDLRWEHRWTPNRRFELGGGIEFRRRAYDGNPENQTELFASLLWRLP